MAVPSRAINARGTGDKVDLIYLYEWVSGSERAETLSRAADIIIVQRLITDDVATQILRWRFAGKPVAVDLDDAYELIPTTSRSYALWKNGFMRIQTPKKVLNVHLKYPAIEQLKRNIKVADALFSPSQLILDDWEDYIPHRYLVPNYIDAHLYEPFRVDETKELVIGWGGSASHYHSWSDSEVIPALRRIAELFPDARFLVAGGNPSILRELRLPPGRLIMNHWVEPEQWPGVLARISIGLIPLAGEYDRRRSWVKPLEYALMGIPWVGVANDSTLPFSSHGILVKPKRDEWVHALYEMVDHYENYRACARERIVWATQQDVYLNTDKLLDTYQRVIDQAQTENLYIIQ